MLVSGSIGEHGTAIVLAHRRVRARGRVESMPRSGRLPTRCWTPPARRSAACATPPAAAWPRSSTSWRANAAVLVDERSVPVKPVVSGAAELLGIDPMYVANEGKLVAFVAPEHADAALSALRSVEAARTRPTSAR